VFGWTPETMPMGGGPSYARFSLGDAMVAGGMEMMPPKPFPGGKLAILADPQGATFAIRQAG
jgi:predicted enzyme related to lactoylglutathione lyase